MLQAIPPTLAVSREQIIVKRRERQRGRSQYEKLGQCGEFHEVREGPCRFLVNFTDYLDTGLFLDHRITRAIVGELASGRNVLNLFCYTATASVHAALGRARSTLSVDMSAPYLEWAARNFALNGLDPHRHLRLQADCLQWLEEQAGVGVPRRFGLIFLDPPTFSRSKRMQTTFDVQRDHVALLGTTAKLLEPDGILLFSTNRERFKLDAGALPGLCFEDITAQTIPKDFVRNPKIHRCWRIIHTNI
jgi:23S rRNA (guanine2445-N2)-methyltransferase / 23S rRNA (guanine2069-N7)-methyltransferase